MSHWESARSLSIHLGEDVCEPKLYRQRYDAQLCVDCGEAPWARDCAICIERYRPHRNCGAHGSEWPTGHGMQCHACWDSKRLKQPEGFEVPAYWPIEKYGHIGPDGLLDRNRPPCEGSTRRCTFHNTTGVHGPFLADAMCPSCVAEDLEDEQELPE
jgi:hypothetical protein